MALWKFIAQVFFHFRSMSATNEPFLLNWGNEGKKLYSSSSLASTDGHISFKKGSKTFCRKYGRQLLNSVKGNCSFILLRRLKIKKKTVCNLKNSHHSSRCILSMRMPCFEKQNIPHWVARNCKIGTGRQKPLLDPWSWKTFTGENELPPKTKHQQC